MLTISNRDTGTRLRMFGIKTMLSELETVDLSGQVWMIRLMLAHPL